MHRYLVKLVNQENKLVATKTVTASCLQLAQSNAIEEYVADGKQDRTGSIEVRVASIQEIAGG